MKKKIVQLGLAALCLSIVANGQTRIPGNWKMIDEKDYSIQYPDSFELNTSGQMGMSFILLSELTSENDLFRENVNLVIQDLTGLGIDLDRFVEISEDQVRTLIKNGNIIESNRIKNGDSEFHKLIYTGIQAKYALKFEQYFWVIQDKAYILTLTCEADQFDKYQEVGEKIMNSFKIRGKKVKYA